MAEAPGWISTITSGSNAAATATRAAVVGSIHVLYMITASFDTTAGAALLTLKDGTDTIAVFDVIGQGNSWIFPKGILITKGNKIDAVLGAGGSSRVGHVNLHGTTLR